jgi:tRNA U34 2-thiouridine synthase MnmA/TrmU
LTPVGARAICTLLFTSSSQNTSLATLDDTDIRRIVVGNVADAMRLALSNMKAFGIKSKDQLYLIKNIVKNNTFFVCKQAQDGALRNSLLRTQLELRQFQQQQTGKSQIDVFGAFNKFKK